MVRSGCVPSLARRGPSLAGAHVRCARSKHSLAPVLDALAYRSGPQLHCAQDCMDTLTLIALALIPAAFGAGWMAGALLAKARAGALTERIDGLTRERDTASARSERA